MEMKQKELNNKCKRSKNWTEEMKETLRMLVEKNIKIIDAKENNSKFIKLKYDAWMSVSQLMKSSGYNISPDKLRQQWNRMKSQAKTSISQYKRDQRTTGGGECPKEPDDLDYSIADMIPDDFVKDTALFDSDNIDNKSVQDAAIVLENSGEKDTVGDVFDNDAEENRKKNTPLKPNKISYKRRRCAKSTTAECMLEERTATIKAGREESQELFKKKLEIENLKIKQMEELHALEVEKKKKEIKLLDLKIQKEEQCN